MASVAALALIAPSFGVAPLHRDGWLFVVLLLTANCVGFVAEQLSFQRVGAIGSAGVSTLLTDALPMW